MAPTWTIDEAFRTPANAELLAYLRRHPALSAHDEVADVLTRSARGLAGVRSYCPDPAAYAFCVLHDRARTIFALAFGQRALCYRLPAERLPEAVGAGGALRPELGSGWVVFDPWSAEHTLDAARWCAFAHEHAARS